MPYKIIATVKDQSSDKFYDVIDMKLSRTKKTLKLFFDEDIAANFARVELKKNDNEFKVIEVESAYEYEPIDIPSESTSSDETESV